MSEPEAADAAETALPTSPEALLAHLDALGIAYCNVTHPPVFTVEEAKALRGELPGCHIKNLFLRNKKGGMRSEEHTSELQSLMRISYAVFCLKTKTHKQPNDPVHTQDNIT